MKTLTTITILSILLLSCTSRTIYKKPKNLIDKDKMISIWTDLYIAHGAKMVKTKNLQKNIDFIPMVLRKYQIDSVQFSQSNFYYTSRVEEYEEMFDEVNTRLEALKMTFQPKKTNRDSLSPVLKEIAIDSAEKKKLKKHQPRLKNIMK